MRVVTEVDLVNGRVLSTPKYLGAVTREDVIDVVSCVTGLTTDQIKSKRRFEPYVNARVHYTLIAVKLFYNLTYIGDPINKDHAGVIHYKKLGANYLRNEYVFRRIHQICLNKVYERSSNSYRSRSKRVSLCHV